MESVSRELIYIWYYFDIQLRQILLYWIAGMLIGSAVSVFAKDGIHRMVERMNRRRWGILGILPAAVLGVLSPLCMYGTIPIAASFRRQGIREDWLASFMMTSVLLNPQLMIYSAALGARALAVRILSALVCGITAGLLIRVYQRRGSDSTGERAFFDFSGFDVPASRDTDPNLVMRYVKNLGRNVKATGLYFLIGILLSALFQTFVPADLMAALFGGNEAWGVLMAATIGVPLYVCGGGTIPLLQEWLAEGMSLGSAAAFMITGPATKITNLGAVKIVLGVRHFALYLAFVLVFSLVCGLVVNTL